jgi:pimeloyl-ACP methyl ester carboxylesterase
VFQYTHGAPRPESISPDAWTFDQALLDRPGNDEIQLSLLHDYRTNPPLYPVWQDYLRTQQPPALIPWGRNDPFFTVAGAQAYLRDLPQAELHLLDAGHFALESHARQVSELILDFLRRNP